MKGLARAHPAAGSAEELAQTLGKLSTLSGDDVALRKELAKLVLDRNDYTAAIRWTEEFIYVDVSNAEIHAMRGNALFHLERYDAAGEESAIAIWLDAQRTDWCFTLAKCYVAVERLDQARHSLDNLLKLDPDYSGAAELLHELKDGP